MNRFLPYAAICTCFFFFSLNSLISQKNWEWQNPFPQGNHLRGSASPAKDVIIMVGDNGTILKSVNGGITWKQQRTRIREDLYAVSFIDENTGMAVGTNGIILKTHNCGESWDKLISGRNDTLRGISMLSSQRIIAVGDTGTLLKSIDGGDTWQYSPVSGFSPNLNGVFFPTPDFGAIVGDSFPNFGGPPVIFSSDSGATFSPLGPDPGLENISINSVWLPKTDPNKLILVGNRGTILNTTTAGSIWNIPSIPTTVPLKHVWFFTEDDGFAIGPNGVLLRTRDCGNTWSLVNMPSNRDNRDLITLTFPDSTRGYIGGGFGAIFTTDNGGNSFQAVQSGFYPDLTDVAFLDDSFGIAVGGLGSILRTANGGNSWEQANSGTVRRWEAVGVAENDPNGTRFWAAGGIFGDSARISFSEDSGVTWTPQPIPSPFKLFDITFSDSLNGMAVGLNGVIYCTKNGGKNWQAKNSGSNEWLLDVSMPNDSCAFVAGGFGTLLKTTNSGNTWTPLNPRTQEWLTAVTFLDDSFGIAAGNHGVIIRTDDGGKNWEDISSPNISIDFTDVSLFRGKSANKTTGFSNLEITAVGHAGTLLYSSDGGDTWNEQFSKTRQNLLASFFRDSLSGWVVGELGTILHTNSQESTVGIEEALWRPTSQSLLGANFPNPIQNRRTRIPFHIPHKGKVSLRIYSMQGQELFRLIEEELLPGSYVYDWEIPRLPNGMYIYQLRFDKRAFTKKLWIKN